MKLLKQKNIKSSRKAKKPTLIAHPAVYTQDWLAKVNMSGMGSYTYVNSSGWQSSSNASIEDGSHHGDDFHAFYRGFHPDGYSGGHGKSPVSFYVHAGLNDHDGWWAEVGITIEGYNQGVVHLSSKNGISFCGQLGSAIDNARKNYYGADTPRGKPLLDQPLRTLPFGIGSEPIVRIASTMPPGTTFENVTSRDLVKHLFSQIPAMTNTVGALQFNTTKTKIVPHGGAYSYVGLGSLYCAVASVRLIKTPNGLSSFGMVQKPGLTQVTRLMPLRSADTYNLEVSIDQTTGRTQFWVNDQGIDVGSVREFKGGGHFAVYGAGTGFPGDHLLSANLTDCGVKSGGLWKETVFDMDCMQNRLKLHHELNMTSSNSLSFRDLRSAVA